MPKPFPIPSLDNKEALTPPTTLCLMKAVEARERTKREKLCSIMEAASALTSLGGTEGSEADPAEDEPNSGVAKGDFGPGKGSSENGGGNQEGTTPAYSVPETPEATVSPAGSKRPLQEPSNKRHIPDHKKPDAALTFPEKLMSMMEYSENLYKGKPESATSISWLPDGNSFVIRDPEAFTRDVLPHFFKATKFSSFTRKLYRWGFRQVNRGIGPHDPIIFGNENFRRDEKELMAKMKSTTAAGSRKAAILLADGPGSECVMGSSSAGAGQGARKRPAEVAQLGGLGRSALNVSAMAEKRRHLELLGSAMGSSSLSVGNAGTVTASVSNPPPRTSLADAIRAAHGLKPKSANAISNLTGSAVPSLAAASAPNKVSLVPQLQSSVPLANLDALQKLSIQKRQLSLQMQMINLQEKMHAGAVGRGILNGAATANATGARNPFSLQATLGAAAASTGPLFPTPSIATPSIRAPNPTASAAVTSSALQAALFSSQLENDTAGIVNAAIDALRYAP